MIFPEDFINKIIVGDCLEVMRGIPDGAVDLVLTDPPYGIGADKGTNGFGSVREKKYSDNWDIKPSKEVFDEILRIGRSVIIFGGNYLADLLPVNGHWIVWDKIGDFKFQNPFSDCELAWTNVSKKVVKKYIVIQQGFIAEEKIRFHPTQKPIGLFNKIIQDYSKDNDLILDPFLGSGTTAVAAKQLGRRFIGIEISPDYVHIANERLKQQYLI